MGGRERAVRDALHGALVPFLKRFGVGLLVVAHLTNEGPVGIGTPTGGIRLAARDAGSSQLRRLVA